MPTERAEAGESIGLSGWQAEPEVRRLANGMTVALLRDSAAPIVSTHLWYRSGAAHEPADQGGVAHFLEHMMFKGAARFGAGQIDQRTLAVGGTNNAYTSHDGTVYVFSLPCEYWRLPLEIEADRMAGLLLEEEEVEAERAVIGEEIAEADDDPWDALSMAVFEGFYGKHPYGRRILGSRESLAGLGREQLAGFHQCSYSPSRAVLMVSGDVGPEVLDAAEELFEPLPAGAHPLPELEAPTGPAREVRVAVARGATRRCLLSLPSPAAGHAEFTHLRLALTALAGGRASVLQGRLVEEGKLCQMVSSEITESVLPGMATLGLELLPGVEPGEVEAVLFAELAACRQRGVDAAVLERSRRLLMSDWLFSHETLDARGATVGAGLALFGDDYARSQVEHLRDATGEDVEAAARNFLDPGQGCVIGWAGC